MGSKGSGDFVSFMYGEKRIRCSIYSAHSQGQKQIVSKIMLLLVHLISRSHVISGNGGYFVCWPVTSKNVKCFSEPACKSDIVLSSLTSKSTVKVNIRDIRQRKSEWCELLIKKKRIKMSTLIFLQNNAIKENLNVVLFYVLSPRLSLRVLSHLPCLVQLNRTRVPFPS